MIDHERKYVMVHIPRTGGWARRDILHPLGGKPKDHLSAEGHIRRMGRDAWDEYYTFSFVRNPWVRLASYYTALRHKGFHDARLYSFEGWFYAKFKRSPKLCRPQWDFVSVGGEGVVDDVFRYEDMSEAWPIVAKKIGVSAELPQHPNHWHYDYRAMYTDRLAEEVGEWDREVIEKFNYSFD